MPPWSRIGLHDLLLVARRDGLMLPDRTRARAFIEESEGPGGRELHAAEREALIDALAPRKTVVGTGKGDGRPRARHG